MVSCFNLPSQLRRRRTDSNSEMVAGFQQRMAIMGRIPGGPPPGPGSGVRREASSPFAQLHHSKSEPLPDRITVKDEADAIPGGLAGMRARMAAMGHTSNSQSDVFTGLTQNLTGQPPSHSPDPMFNNATSSSPSPMECGKR
eukprot:3176583-Rhodomonas_salina.2